MLHVYFFIVKIHVELSTEIFVLSFPELKSCGFMKVNQCLCRPKASTKTNGEFFKFAQNCILGQIRWTRIKV